MVGTSKLSPSNKNMIECKEDRISSLPDALIHQILSSIDTKLAVKTWLLSKRWADIWQSLPFLNIHIHSYTGCESCGFGGANDDTSTDFVDRVLQQRDDCGIQRLRVTWGSFNDAISVNRWIDAAIRRNVQEVTIELSKRYGLEYSISPKLLTCKSLKRLTLKMDSDDFEDARVLFPQTISLPQLKFMCLDGFLVDDVESTKRLFSSCPLLEELNIVNCDIPTDNQGNFTVKSLSLKKFTYTYQSSKKISDTYDQYGISGNSRCKDKPTLIRLCAPNLKNFTCESSWTQEYDLQNCSDQLSDVKLNILSDGKFANEQLKKKEVYASSMVKLLVAVDKMKRLDLSSGFLEVFSSATDLLHSQLPCLHNLECLRLETSFTRDSWRAVTYLLSMSPNVDALILAVNPSGVTRNRRRPRGLVKSDLADILDDSDVRFSLSHLKVIRIENAKGCDAEFKVLRFLMKNAKSLEEISVYPCSRVDSLNRLKRQYEIKPTAFPRASSRIQMRWRGKQSTCRI